MPPASTAPPYRMSLERSLRDLQARDSNAAKVDGLGESPSFPQDELQAWLDTVGKFIALYHSVEPAPSLIEELGRPGRFSASPHTVPDQIVIPFHGTQPFFVRCLASLAAAGTDGTGLLLCDTGTPDADLARLLAFCREAGFDVTLCRGNGRQAIIREVWETAWGAVPRRMISVNSDTIVSPGFVGRLLAVMDEHPEIKISGAVSSAPADLCGYRPGFEDGPEETLVERAWRFHHSCVTRHAGTITAEPYISFTCMAVDSMAWKEVSPGAAPFDYGDHFDIDVSCRLRQAGYQLAVREDTTVYHLGQATNRELGARDYKEVLDRTLLFVDLWGHLPEHFDLMHQMFCAAQSATSLKPKPR